MRKNTQTFRASVGVVVIDSQGRVLAFERADTAGQWQLPQGGLNAGEEPLAAAKRELWEETGLGEEEVHLLAEHPEWLVYELPRHSAKHGRGQAQKWFLFELKKPKRIELEGAHSGEFTGWKWTTLEQLYDETVEFRKGVYARLMEHFAPYLGGRERRR
jgi:putative (di)nucleoside polyphosphate hydrolase